MIEIEQQLKIHDQNWLMSAREKLGLIGLLQCMKPETVIEFGYHRGGATKWLSQFSKKIITVDVNEFVSDAPYKYSNLEAWNCSTLDAIKRIREQNLSFDLAIIDADHTREAVFRDVQGILPYSNVILMHDSFNPECRKGLLDALKTQESHAYYLDFIPALVKHDGLWGGLAIAWRSGKPGAKKEFDGEKSPIQIPIGQSIFSLKPNLTSNRFWISEKAHLLISYIRIKVGKILKKS